MSILRTPRSRIAAAALAVVVAVGGGAFGVIRASASAPQNAAPPLQEVDVANVLSKTITDWQTYSGRLEAIERVDVRPLVSGTIVSVNFKDGALVKKGDVLFVIDPRPYQAEVDRTAAQLAAAQARDGYAQTDWQRAQRLIGDNAIAKRDYDEKQNAARESAANVKAAAAALEAAKINLGYTRIVAPFTGRASRAEITLGNVVSAGASAAPLTTLVSVSPIYASFDADEQTYLRYIGNQRDGRKVPVDLGLANESGYSRSGVIDSVDNRLDTSSGTIRVRARFDNADGTLVPGLYARVKVDGSAPHPALLVDDAAINTDQDKKFVFVVDAQGKVAYREVQIGSLHGNQRVIAGGLQASDRVVVNGTQRVRPGEQVKVHMVPMTGGDDAAAPVAAASQPAAGSASS
ncbi:efflux RND transporter periplasmic adaptor subunit [Burkholderia gladioli]|jgi:multidrug efflux system membrane fusion protein|uniref:Efflux RND transporter periplasmic adaptor subunit n=1 Tax=Burkholderia gladioli TaxID=28095 RepID=A0AB38TZC1_BURGA|nr:efflux RND transporter periplasmic adaptor subunit [Burkholderia gladioli]MBU9270694.1 efflux RND transporter periplasmic adaptor subunit [Burkholderia gladioli]MBU9277013.1 efflux RND transporter periplasmic adaptor subunit [Burkholderia gladioli]MBU9685289.1 efflux RND transporter periplasmic adaptor subunit [Burkholderia gladioli]MCA8172301.1 efflux RND transporter periplasmic adaptor subunit [Burkholderia gladioli]MDA0575024.1 efflux RND transporter periplasmic adaptor subunit [Burkhold